MINPEVNNTTKNIDLGPWNIAVKITDVLDVHLRKINGIQDTDEKILACYIEMLSSDELSAYGLARKYNINVDYMMHKLSEFRKRLQQEPDFKAKYIKVTRAFGFV